MARDRILQIYRGTTAQNNAFTGAQGELTMDTDRKEIRIHDGSTAGGNVVGLTPGFIAPFAGSTAPDGWLVCDGSAISRTRYADLFAVIGTTYGSGDGNTTFNLPDFSDGKSPIGVGTNYALGTSTNGAAPNITGSTTLRGADLGINNTSVQTGCFDKGTTLTNGKNVGLGDTITSRMLGFDASRSSSVYGANNTVKIVTSGTAVYICIKY